MRSDRALTLLPILIALCSAPVETAATTCEVGRESRSAAGASPESSPEAAGDDLADLRASYERANAVREALAADPERFDALAVEALDAAAALADPVERATVLLHVARSLMLRGQATRAARGPEAPAYRSLVVRAGAAFARSADLATAAGALRIRSFADGYRSTLYAEADRQLEALALNESALIAAASIPDPVLLARWSAQRGRLLESTGRSEKALEAYRLARSHLGRARAGLSPQAYLELARPISLRLADLLLRTSGVGDEVDESRLEEAQQTLELLKVAEIQDYFDDPCLGAQRQTVAAEIPSTTVLYPVLLEERVELLVIRNRRYHRFVSPAKSDEVLAEARRFEGRLQDPTSFRFRASATKLYEQLIRPAGILLEDPASTLVVVPPAELAGVPFGALLDAEEKSFLVERVPLAVTPSMSLTEPRPIDRDGIFTLIAGLTTEVEGFELLRFVEAEVEAVRASFPGDALKGEAFTADALAARFRAKPYGILHVASHGVFEGDPRESFVMTGSGRLSIDRLSEIVQQARFRTDRSLELLTLSACETAVGDSRAVLGLAGVAIRSGARSALGSLWKVGDEPTQQLIAAFYRELAKPGVSRAVALQRAQRELLSTRRFRHPVYWASFILVNSWL